MSQLDFDLLHLVQSLGDGFYPLMKSLTTIGDAKYYFLAIVILMWCVNFRTFSRMALLIPLCGALTESLKIAFRMPRPYHIEEGVTAITSFGMPSGHALSAVAFWGYLAAIIRKRWFTILSIFLITGIGVSRVYRGSHFPSQVAVGFILGLIILVTVLLFQERFSHYFIRCSTPLKHFFMLLPVLVITGLCLISNACYHDSVGLENTIEAVTNCGLFYGFALSLYRINRKGIRFDVRVGPVKQLIKVVFSIACIMLYIFVNKYAGKTVSFNQELGLLILFFSNALAALIFAYFVPILFSRLALIHLSAEFEKTSPAKQDNTHQREIRDGDSTGADASHQ